MLLDPAIESIVTIRPDAAFGRHDLYEPVETIPRVLPRSRPEPGLFNRLLDRAATGVVSIARIADPFRQAASTVVMDIDGRLQPVCGNVHGRVVTEVLRRLQQTFRGNDLAAHIAPIRKRIGVGVDALQLPSHVVVIDPPHQLLERTSRVRLQGIEGHGRPCNLPVDTAKRIVLLPCDKVSRLSADFAPQTITLDRQRPDPHQRPRLIVRIGRLAPRGHPQTALPVGVVDVPQQFAMLIFTDQAAAAVVRKARHMGVRPLNLRRCQPSARIVTIGKLHVACIDFGKPVVSIVSIAPLPTVGQCLHQQATGGIPLVLGRAPPSRSRRRVARPHRSGTSRLRPVR